LKRWLVLVVVAAVVLASLLVIMRPAAPSPTALVRPNTYDDFDTSVLANDAVALKKLIQGNAVNFIYLRNGTYKLNNPVYINRPTSLYVHGQDEMRTVLVAQNPTQPLFIVQNATILNFAGLDIDPTRDAPSTILNQWLWLQNANPLQLEVTDSCITATTTQLDGPGTANLQQNYVKGLGRVLASVMVNHPQMDAFVIQGDWGFGHSLAAGLSEHAFIWQKQGHVSIHALNFEGQVGTCAIRIESSGGKFGPHFIADNRSEGTNGAAQGALPSCYLYVPPTGDAVDVVMKSNYFNTISGPAYAYLSNVTGTFSPNAIVTVSGLSPTTQAAVIDWNAGLSRINFNTNGSGYIGAGGAFVNWSVGNPLPADWVGKTITQTSPTSASGTLDHWDKTKAWNNASFINYNGAGKVWMIGNVAFTAGKNLVIGCPRPAAKLISIGNVFPTTAYYNISPCGGTTLSFDDMHWSAVASPSMKAGNLDSQDADFTQPTPRWVSGSGAPPASIFTYNQTGSVPEPPRETIPMPILRPPMRHALPGMVDAKAAFGLHGDGIADDTAGLQSVWDSRCSPSVTPVSFWFACGTYLVSARTYLFSGPSCSTSTTWGGWLAGAGSSCTKFKMAPGVKHGILRADSFGYITMQGISFEADPWTTDLYFGTVQLTKRSAAVTGWSGYYNFPPASFVVGQYVVGAGIPVGTTIASVQSSTAFTLSNPVTCSGSCSENVWVSTYPQEGLFETTAIHGNTQGMGFYDVSFDGGFAGYGAGNHNPDGNNSSSEGIYSASFKNEYMGIMQGHGNVISDGVDQATFYNNYINQGWYYDVSPGPSTATFSMSYHATSTGCKLFDNTIGTYFFDYTSDTPIWRHDGNSANPAITFLDQSSLSPNPSGGPSYLGGTSPFTISYGAGPIFLHTSVSRTKPSSVNGAMAQAYMLKLWSTIPDWSSITTNSPNGITDKDK